METRPYGRWADDGSFYIKIPREIANSSVIKKIIDRGFEKDNGRFKVNILNISPTRTLSQNDMLHKMFRQIALECNGTASASDIESVKSGLKEQAVRDEKYPTEEYIDEKGEIKVIPKSTADLSTQEMSRFIDFIALHYPETYFLGK